MILVSIGKIYAPGWDNRRENTCCGYGLILRSVELRPLLNRVGLRLLGFVVTEEKLDLRSEISNPVHNISSCNTLPNQKKDFKFKSIFSPREYIHQQQMRHWE